MGAWYETEMWERYHAEKPDTSPDLMLLSVGHRNASHPGVFFHGGEDLIKRQRVRPVAEWVGRHPYQTTFYGFAVVCAAVVAYFGLGQTVLEYQTTKKGYRVLEYLPTTWRPRAHGG